MALGKRVKAIREGLGWTHYRLAQEAGLPQTQLKKIEDGTTDPQASTVEKIAKGLGVPVGDLYGWPGGQTPKGLDHDDPRPEHTVEVPIRAVLIGGHQVTAEEMSTPDSYRLLSHMYRPGREVIRVHGESMWPTLCSGDLILVDTKEKVRDGQIGVVRINRESTIKRVFRPKRGGGLLLKGDNPTFPVIETDGDEIEVLGRVIAVVQRTLQ